MPYHSVQAETKTRRKMKILQNPGHMADLTFALLTWYLVSLVFLILCRDMFKTMYVNLLSPPVMAVVNSNIIPLLFIRHEGHIAFPTLNDIIYDIFTTMFVTLFHRHNYGRGKQGHDPPVLFIWLVRYRVRNLEWHHWHDYQFIRHTSSLGYSV